MLVNVTSKSLNAGITKFPKLSNGTLNLDFGVTNFNIYERDLLCLDIKLVISRWPG